MVTIGSTLMCEQRSPIDLVRDAVTAEGAGFDFLAIAVEPIIVAVCRHVDAGFTHLALVQVGPDQEELREPYSERLRRRCASRDRDRRPRAGAVCTTLVGGPPGGVVRSGAGAGVPPAGAGAHRRARGGPHG